MLVTGCLKEYLRREGMKVTIFGNS
eukprot:SAG31_NODE_41336_length_276_cov_1.163842_1_plen_24_part_10